MNRTLPDNILAPGQAMPARFSKEPADEELFAVHFFEEPLVPVEAAASPEENTELVYALAAFSQRKSADDFTAISRFLKKYPQSRWRGALWANLGILYRRTGYYGEAMEVWQQAWEVLKKQKARSVKVLADRVLSELLLLNAWVGRAEKMESLLKEMEKRVMEGPAGERVAAVRQALWIMKNKPGIAFKCGPYALNKIYVLQDSTQPFNEKLMAVQSTAKGFSLRQLEHMARDIRLNYRMAFRSPGAPVIPRAVVHWKLNHYSVLLKEENGYYKCEDATMGTVYGQQFWLTPAALDSSASGYFLVPDGPLPPGWRQVMPAEGSNVFGKGQEPPDKGKHVSGGDKQLPDCKGGKPMAQSNVHAGAISLHIFDAPVYYAPPKGPEMIWKVEYHQRDSYQPANFAYSNLGPKWTFNWLSYVQDDPANPSANANVYLRGGGVRTFTSFDSATQSYARELQSNDVLVRVCPGCYELRHPDGSKEVFARPDGSTVNGRKVFLTETIDATGNKMTLLYDARLRIVALKDAIGQVTTIEYGNTSDVYKITRVIDPFGRSATFRYDASGRMNQVTDMIGIVSSFVYGAGDFISQMNTPYGATRFIKTEGPGTARSLETWYPLGEKERVEFMDNAPGINFSETIYPQGMNIFNQYLTFRNTFFWDKKAMSEAPGDYTKARIYHWLHGSQATGESGEIAPILESIKDPLENRVWFNYQGQPWAAGANQGMSPHPSVIGRVLDDSTTQLTKVVYTAAGIDSISIDPSGRRTTYKYAPNNIDLLEISQTTGSAHALLAAFTYNSQHLPLTVKDASGQVTTYTYTASGQLKSITNAKNQTTTLYYSADGYLDSMVGPVPGSRAKYTYDGFGRIRTVTGPEGFTLTTDYDALNRPTLITYPDSTYEQIVYNRLDAVHRRDRLGRWSHTVYDSLDRPAVIQDELGRVTQLIWCGCGSLDKIVDPLKQVTSFTRDLQGRVIAKTYHDGKAVTLRYERTTSRLKEITDARGQKTHYSYFIDNNLKQVTYADAVLPTPSVSFTYDSLYNRVTTMKDGAGTTAYSYKPAGSGPGSGRLSAIDGPLPNDALTYTYDELGRMTGRSVNGVASSVVMDALGRVTSVTNALGSFAYQYVSQTNRLSSISMPNGQRTAFDYFNTAGDNRLKQIWNKASNGSTLSKFDYEYNREGEITKWTQQAGAAVPVYYTLGYDPAGQLIAATQRDQSALAVVKRYAYQYDQAGNRTGEQVDNSVTSAVYNSVNQVTRQQPGGPMRFAGTVSEAASVKVTNQTSSDSGFASVDTAHSFEAFVNVNAGPNHVSITATDYSGNNNKATNNYSISVTGGSNNTQAFDNNGNLVSATSPAVTYAWDAADRLVKITKGGSVTEFVYDGLNRRVAEKLNGSIIKTWLWDGTELSEERDGGGGTVTKRFFDQGEQIGGTNYYFTGDHLGSVREVVAGDGITIKARYDYDPYGRRLLTAGTDLCDLGFTGHYFHKESGLHLALYRAYDARLGRWLSRDPIEENGGVNLYGYAGNNPVSFMDPLGLDWLDNLSNFSAGFGDVISFGLTEKIREWQGINGVVDKCSGAYNTGWWAGIAHGLVTGGAGIGKSAAGRLTAVNGRVYSHWIPNRFFTDYLPRITGRRFARWVDRQVGRSIFNGNFVTRQQHYFHDIHATVQGWTRTNPGKWGFFRQQLDRLPGINLAAIEAAILARALSKDPTE